MQNKNFRKCRNGRVQVFNHSQNFKNNNVKLNIGKAGEDYCWLETVNKIKLNSMITTEI